MHLSCTFPHARDTNERTSELREIQLRDAAVTIAPRQRSDAIVTNSAMRSSSLVRRRRNLGGRADISSAKINRFVFRQSVGKSVL